MGKTKPERVVFLDGERVYLRPLELEDLDRCVRWLNEPSTRIPLGGPGHPLNRIAERKFIENASDTKDSVHLAIVLKQGDRHIGGCGLGDIRWTDRSARYGIFIGEPDHRRKGHGTEVTRLVVKYAFETLNLNRVELGVLDFNDGAIRAYEKAGFVREGVQREYCFRDGAYHDHIMYSILAREYFADQAARDQRASRRPRRRSR